MRHSLLTLLFATAGMVGAQSKNLDIYWIDVEGGASTLYVSPSGESMLVDTGYETDGRDPKHYGSGAGCGLEEDRLCSDQPLPR